MTISDAIDLLCQNLLPLFDDRDDLEELARAADIAIGEVLTGENRAEFLCNILAKAHQEEKVDNLVMRAIASHGDPEGHLQTAYVAYEMAIEERGPSLSNLPLSNLPLSQVNPVFQINADGSANADGDDDIEQGAITQGDIEQDTIKQGNIADQDQSIEQDDADHVGGSKIEVGDIGDSDGVAIGPNAKAFVHKVHNVYNNKISQLPPGIQRAVNIGVSLIAIIVMILVLGFFGTQIFAYFTPLWLEDDFNIAVLDFGEIQPSGEIVSSRDGREMSKWLYKGLSDSYEQFSLSGNTKSVSIIHRTASEAAGQQRKLRPLLVSEPAARCDGAKKLASDINAQMVIYGTLNRQLDPAEFDLQFYISPSVQNWLELNDIQLGTNTATMECLPLGELVAVPQPFSDASIRDHVRDNVASRGAIFFWLTLALIQGRQGDWQNALPYLNQVEAHLNRLQREEAKQFGADLVATLIGQQYLRKFSDQVNNADEIILEKLDLALFDSAAENFQNAIDYKGRHQFWAEKGMGDIWAYMGRLAQKLYYQNGSQDDERLDIPKTYTTATEIVPNLRKHHQNLAQSLSHASTYYQWAANHMADQGDSHVALVIDFALAETQWQAGQLFYIKDEYDEAIPKMKAFIEAIHQDDDSLLSRAEAQGSHRMIATAYEMSGLTYVQLADMLRIRNQFDERIEYLRSAEEFYTQCIAKADDAQLDKLITNEIVAGFCQPQLKVVQQALEDAQAHAGE